MWGPGTQGEELIPRDLTHAEMALRTLTQTGLHRHHGALGVNP